MPVHQTLYKPTLNSNSFHLNPEFPTTPVPNVDLKRILLIFFWPVQAPPTKVKGLGSSRSYPADYIQPLVRIFVSQMGAVDLNRIP